MAWPFFQPVLTTESRTGSRSGSVVLSLLTLVFFLASLSHEAEALYWNPTRIDGIANKRVPESSPMTTAAKTATIITVTKSTSSVRASPTATSKALDRKDPIIYSKSAASTTNSATPTPEIAPFGLRLAVMPVIFQTEKQTPLFSRRWTPKSTGAYAGTCIFVAVLAILHRGILSLARIATFKYHPDTSVTGHQEQQGQAQQQQSSALLGGDLEQAVGTTGTAADQPKVEAEINSTEPADEIERQSSSSSSSSMSTKSIGCRLCRLVAKSRAILITLSAGVGYLLMLAVMTLNVGYFLSVLSGILVGEVVFGR